LDPEGGSQKATLVVVVLLVVISSLKIPFFLHFRADIPHRSTVSDIPPRGVVAILDLGERFWKRRFRHRGASPRARPKAVLGMGAGGGRPLPPWRSGGSTPGKILKF